MTLLKHTYWESNIFNGLEAYTVFSRISYITCVDIVLLDIFFHDLTQVSDLGTLVMFQYARKNVTT